MTRRKGPAERLSVVVPTLNEENHIGLLLSDLAKQTKEPDEVIVVDGGSEDGTVSVVEGFSGVRLLSGAPSVSGQRNEGGRSAGGDVLIFLDADVRLGETFLQDFLAGFERRDLDVACSLYMPQRGSSAAVKGVHLFFNAVFLALQGVLSSGSGQCVGVRREVFRGSGGFDTGLKFADDIELVRRLSKSHRFGVVPKVVRVSDRRFREHGVARVFGNLLLMSVFFTIGRFEWANLIEYEFGNHGR